MASSTPSILWIVTTQWRAQACGYAGDPNARTPFLDRYARDRAINYAQAVTPHPHGPFARAALLTGKPSPENGVRDYYDPLPKDARTIAHDLSDYGYTTAFFGKWHLAARDPAAPLVGEPHARMVVPPEARGGFDFWEGFEGGFLLNDPWLHGTRLPEPSHVRGYQSDVVCERAAAWLDEQTADKPFFGVVSLEPPHPPYGAAAAGIDGRPPQEILLPANVPRGGETEQKARKELAGYYAHIEATDRALGRLLDYVRDDVITVVTSVHGDMHGAHGLFRKGWPHEESIRVPLLVRAPGMPGFAPGETSAAAVSLLDTHCWTRMWASGQREMPPPTTTGTRISMPSVVALPHQCDRVWSGYRYPEEKLILNADSSPWLYFDLRADPLETKNLVDVPQYAKRIAQRRAELLAKR